MISVNNSFALEASELNFEVIETAAFYGNSKVAEDLGITFPENLASNAKELLDRKSVV